MLSVLRQRPRDFVQRCTEGGIVHTDLTRVARFVGIAAVYVTSGVLVKHKRVVWIIEILVRLVLIDVELGAP